MRGLSSKKQKKYLTLIGIIAGVYLGMKFIVPLFIPFLFAGIIVMMIYPCVKWLHCKIKLNKGVAATVIILLIGGIISVLIWLMCAQLFEQIKNVSSRIHIYERQLCHFIRCSCESVERTFGINAVNFEALILKNVNDMADNLQADTVPNLMNNSVFYIKGLAEFIGALIIAIISVILLAKDYDSIKEKCSRYEGFQMICEILQKVMMISGTFIKAQLIIMLVTAILCGVTFWILKNPYALLVGLIIGVLDALPFIGTGLILIPWAIIELLSGRYINTIVLLILFAVCALSREFLEPKLIGQKLGVYPIVIMIAIYVGIKLYGIAGIIMGPVSFLLMYELIKRYISESDDNNTTSGMQKDR